MLFLGFVFFAAAFLFSMYMVLSQKNPEKENIESDNSSKRLRRLKKIHPVVYVACCIISGAAIVVCINVYNFYKKNMYEITLPSTFNRIVEYKYSEFNEGQFKLVVVDTEGKPSSEYAPLSLTKIKYEDDVIPTELVYTTFVLNKYEDSTLYKVLTFGTLEKQYDSYVLILPNDQKKNCPEQSDQNQEQQEQQEQQNQDEHEDKGVTQLKINN